MIINPETHLTIRKIKSIDNTESWGIIPESNINREYLKESYLSTYCSKNKVYLLKCPDYTGLLSVDLKGIIPLSIIEEVQNKKMIFALDCSSEATYEMVDAVYSELIDKLKLPACQVLLIATSVDLKKRMDYLNREPFKIECFDFFERLMQRQMRYFLSPTEKIPKLNSPLLNDTFSKKFICLNRMPRLHRLALLRMLSKKDLVRQGYYSFPIESNTKDMLDNVEETYSNLTHLMDPTEKVLKSLPLNVDTHDILGLNHAYTPQRDLMKFYRDSYFSIVLETYFENHHLNFFTEKIFKPIIHKHPFVLVSTPHMLESLRSYGYKTFDSIIDESYDKIEDPSDRLIAVVNEIERLCNLSESELVEFKTKSLEIVNHNYNVIMSKTNFIKTVA